MNTVVFSDELNEVLRLVSQELREVLTADRCSVQLFDEDSSVIMGSKAGVSAGEGRSFGSWRGPRDRPMAYPVHDEKLGRLLEGSVVAMSSLRDPGYDACFEGFFRNTSSVGLPCIYRGRIVAMAWVSVYDPEVSFGQGPVQAARSLATVGGAALANALEVQRLRSTVDRQRELVVQGCEALLAELDLSAGRPPAGSARGPIETQGEALTDRELEVLSLLARGLTNKEIGERLFVSVNTVKGHVQHVLTKLGARNRSEAASMARELGLG